MDDLTNYIPPQSEAAEQSVLGGLMLDNSAWIHVQGVLTEKDFYRRDHQLLFYAIAKLLTTNRPADLVTVGEFFEKQNRFDEVGGWAYIGGIAKNTPSSANITAYANIVRDRSIKRQLIALSAEITQKAFAGVDDAKDLLSQAETGLFLLSQLSTKGKKGFVRVKQSLSEVVNQIEATYGTKSNGDVLGVSSGFYDLDKLTSGFCGGQFWIVAGRPAMGKSAFVVNIAEAAAKKENVVAFFSMEMSHEEISQRMLSANSRVELQKIRQSWEIEDEHWARITAGLVQICDLPLFIDDTPALTLSDIRSRCMRLNSEVMKEGLNGVGMVVIDYLQLMGSESAKGSNRNTEIEEITRGLKRLAKEMDIPVIALAQLNRELEKSPDKRPKLSNLRDSGGIEQDADGVIFLYRDEVYNKESLDKGIAEVIIGKQRHGSLGTIKLLFDGPCTTFRNMDRPYSVNHYD